MSVIARTCEPSAFAIASLLPEPWPEVKAISAPVGDQAGEEPSDTISRGRLAVIESFEL